MPLSTSAKQTHFVGTGSMPITVHPKKFHLWPLHGLGISLHGLLWPFMAHAMNVNAASVNVNCCQQLPSFLCLFLHSCFAICHQHTSHLAGIIQKADPSKGQSVVFLHVECRNCIQCPGVPCSGASVQSWCLHCLNQLRVMPLPMTWLVPSVSSGGKPPPQSIE